MCVCVYILFGNASIYKWSAFCLHVCMCVCVCVVAIVIVERSSLFNSF